jgi:leader peptidase (prepilin peptidase)/N-methyltransferase
MGFDAVFSAGNWPGVGSPLWVALVFWLGCMVGSFLNVCIHRMPLGLSVVNPPSHCPQCKYAIPWYLNVPLLTWLMVRGRCRNCGAPISIRYFLVELLTGMLFFAAWLAFAGRSPLLALVYCLFLAGLIAATFIDFEHFIIPDEITIGGMVVGVILSALVPQLHGSPGAASLAGSLKAGLIGMAVGGGTIYAILRFGKLLFGRQKMALPADTRIVFGETAVILPDREIPYEELFYRKSDVIAIKASTVELVDRGYRNVELRLSPDRLRIGADEFNPEEVKHVEAVSAELVLPREAMGFGDVKFMAAIGAFLGWQATVFSLMVSSMIGAAVGVALIALGRQQWSSRLPYGPYIALAAVIWMFGGRELWQSLFHL